MKKTLLAVMVGFLAGVALTATLGAAYAQIGQPSGRVQFTASVNLAPEFETIGPYQLRLRMLHMDPGVKLDVHSHAGRPAIILVLDGKLTEVREGVPKDIEKGQGTWITKSTPHAIQNNGSVKAVYVEADVVRQEQQRQ